MDTIAMKCLVEPFHAVSKLNKKNHYMLAAFCQELLQHNQRLCLSRFTSYSIIDTTVALAGIRQTLSYYIDTKH